ncbi:PEP-CTERM sorting domain-containing protein [Pacificimonas sp. WHA3]|uniref:PEP-CTERM sorting domain-containing protein n=1 Tax=Pacificimonas pallii TaxID=2827236 RepID=A0ABS6SFB3_9SPHN|nr:PEP-CTERM sorting domain-containing protein [Pacificimonas pallii]
MSAASNSLLPQPGNNAPLAMLLDDDADALTLTMGSSSSGTITIDFYSDLGVLQSSVTQALVPSGYEVYTYSGLGTFRGVAFRDNTDASGLRFMNFSYNSVDAGPVPAPGALGLLGLGLLVMAGRARRA